MWWTLRSLSLGNHKISINTEECNNFRTIRFTNLKLYRNLIHFSSTNPFSRRGKSVVANSIWMKKRSKGDQIVLFSLATTRTCMRYIDHSVNKIRAFWDSCRARLLNLRNFISFNLFFFFLFLFLYFGLREFEAHIHAI